MTNEREIERLQKVKEDIGKRLRSRRTLLGWKTSTASRESGLDRATIQRIEYPKGNRTYSMNKLLKYINALGIIDRFFYYFGSMPALIVIEKRSNSADITKLLRLIRGYSWIRRIFKGEDGQGIILFGEFPDADILGTFVLEMLKSWRQEIKKTRTTVILQKYKNMMLSDLQQDKKVLGVGLYNADYSDQEELARIVARLPSVKAVMAGSGGDDIIVFVSCDSQKEALESLRTIPNKERRLTKLSIGLELI